MTNEFYKLIDSLEEKLLEEKIEGLQCLKDLHTSLEVGYFNISSAKIILELRQYFDIIYELPRKCTQQTCQYPLPAGISFIFASNKKHGNYNSYSGIYIVNCNWMCKSPIQN